MAGALFLGESRSERHRPLQGLAIRRLDRGPLHEARELEGKAGLPAIRELDIDFGKELGIEQAPCFTRFELSIP